MKSNITKKDTKVHSIYGYHMTSKRLIRRIFYFFFDKKNLLLSRWGGIEAPSIPINTLIFKTNSFNRLDIRRFRALPTLFLRVLAIGLLAYLFIYLFIIIIFFNFYK